jgi:hypothetical protein
MDELLAFFEKGAVMIEGRVLCTRQIGIFAKFTKQCDEMM